MNVDVNMPDFGGDANQGTIVAWHKRQGDAVVAGELLLEVMTDKVNVEVEAPASGIVVEVLRAQDDVVPVGETIARIRPA